MSLRLLAAGACYTNGAFERCALQPSECSSSQTYRSSRWLAANDSQAANQCADQSSIHNIPALGRCDSASERYMCTSHKSACFVDVSFRDLDPDCTVLHDFRPVDTPFTRSYFGECATTQQGKAQNLQDYCAWQFSECPKGGSYVFEPADEFFAGQRPSCQCDKVKTGACVSTTVASDYFCAVSEYVCDTEQDLQYLKAFEVEAQLGTTCKLCDSLPSQPQKLFTQAGACIVDSTNSFKRCALLPEHCNAQEESFVSPRRLEIDGGSLFPAAAQECLTEQGLHQVRVGRCAADADQHICVSDATACKISQSFQPNDDDCLLVRDLNGDKGGLSTTHFGHCTADELTTFSGYVPGRENFCAWGFQECQSPEPNARPLTFGNANPGMAAALPTCQCDDVRVGACVNMANPTNMYCAVAALACDDGFEYKGVRALESPSGTNTICYLCKPLPHLEANPSPLPSPPSSSPPGQPAPTWPSVPTAGSGPTPQQPTVPTTNLEQEHHNNELAVGAVVGIILGVVMTTCMFSIVLCLFMMRRRHGGDDESLTENCAAAATEQASDSDAQQHESNSRHQELSDGIALEEGQTEEDFVIKDGKRLT